MPKKTDPNLPDKKHDERVFYAADAIFGENDLRELINVVYSQYRFKRSQIDKLAQLIEFLAFESNRFSHPELVGHRDRFSSYLDNFHEFLKSNFQPGPEIENGDVIFVFNTSENSSETEAFLAEFQMVSLDIEKAYRGYRSSVISHLASR